MKHLLAILCFAFLASCAGRVPRAIIPPPSVVEMLDVEPVSKAGKATREAVREIAKAGTGTRETAALLLASIDRAEKIAAAHAELAEAFAEIQALTDRLQVDLAFAEEKEKIALDVIDALEEETAILKANAQSQAVQIRSAEAAEATLRTQVETLSKLPDELAAAKQQAATFKWWVWRLGICSAVLALAIAALAYLLLKP